MIGLHEPSFDLEDEACVLEALRSTWVSTAGPFVDKFEKALAEYLGVRFAVCVCNGTVGLELVIETLKRVRGVAGNFDIIVPALSFIGTYTSIISKGGVPVLVDCAEKSMQISLSEVSLIVERNYRLVGSRWENKKTKNTLLAIMPAHLMGWGCQTEELFQLGKRLSIPVIEDAAEALGCFYDHGRHLGSRSQAAVISFNGNKILTCGGGGVVITNDASFANRIRHLSNTAKVDPIYSVHDEPGFNCRLTNLQAALGYSQLKKIETLVSKKKLISDWYSEAFSDEERLYLYQESSFFRSNYWLNNIILENSGLRDYLIKVLSEEGIQSRPLWTPFYLQPYYQGEENDFPNTEWIWERALSLPSSSTLTAEQVARISRLIQKNCRFDIC